MTSPSTLAQLKELLAPHLPASKQGDQPLILLAICDHSSTRRTLSCDDDVKAVFTDAAVTGAVQIEVRDLFPSAGAQPIQVRVPVPAAKSHDAVLLTSASHHTELQQELQQDEFDRYNWMPNAAAVVNLLPGMGDEQNHRAVRRSQTPPTAIHPGPCSEWAERSNLSEVGLKTSFGVPWPDVCLPDSRSSWSLPTTMESGRQALEPVATSSVSGDFAEEGTSSHLMKAMGLSQPYTQLRTGLRQHRLAVESMLQERDYVLSPVQNKPWAAAQSSARTGNSRHLQIHGRDLPKLRRTMHLLREMESTCSETLQEGTLTASWQVAGARQLLAEERRAGSRAAFLLPRKMCWLSPWTPLGRFSQVAFRIYPGGDRESSDGQVVLFFWLQTPQPLSFSFSIQVGELLAIERSLWPAKAGWVRVEISWAVLQTQLSAMDLKTSSLGLELKLVLLEWHSQHGREQGMALSCEEVVAKDKLTNLF